MTRVFSHAYRLFLASPLLFGFLVWWYKDRVFAAIQKFAADYYWAFWAIFIVGLLMLTIAALHYYFDAILKIWPEKKWPRAREIFMRLVDQYTNKERLIERLSSKVRAEKFDAAACTAFLKTRIIGQDAICDQIASTLRLRLGQTDRTQPVGKFLFAGPPSVGKTELAKVLGEYLKRGFIFEDMTQCASPEKVNTLFGSPKGYAGSDSYGTLTKALMATPRSVVLLDEIEKAHPSVQTRFLTAWNDGFVVEASDNKKIQCNQTIWIATTNAAFEAINQARAATTDADELKVATTNILMESGFRPEVLSRIDEVFVFDNLRGLDVADLTILKLKAIAKKYDLEIEQDEDGIDLEILAQAVERSERLQQAGGIRELDRTLEKAIGHKMLDVRETGATTVRLYMSGEKLDDIEVEAVS